MKNHVITCMLMCCLLFVLSSCENNDELINEKRELSGFSYIEIYDFMNVYISQTKNYSVQIESNTQLLDKLETTLSGDSLFIHNNNKNRWLRAYDDVVNIYINTPELRKVVGHGFCNLYSIDTIKSDYLHISLHEGCGVFDLTLDVSQCYIGMHSGNADFFIDGKSQRTDLVGEASGELHCEYLISPITQIRNSNTNTCYVYAAETINAHIEWTGNIYYSGAPDVVNLEKTGSGNLIEMNK